MSKQIYIHIPFCEQKCNYCRFASIGKIQNLHIEKYVSFLCEEIAHPLTPSLLRRGDKISTIYFGGGTPGVLKLEQFEKILKTIKNKYILKENCEISIETTPDKITKKNLIGWEKLGINRISMGIQTLNEKSLEEIGRGNKGDIIKALEIFKKHNLIKNISIDFIIGLPYVKKGEILENIKNTLNNYSFIKHISVYMLEDYYSADKIIETKYDNITYPDDWGKQGIREEEYLEEYLEEYSSIKKYLLKNGFDNYEISNYGKIDHPQPLLNKEGRDYKCKHNIGYWNHSEILAFGLGAYGLTLLNKEGSNNKEFIRYANSDNFKDYYSGKKLFENKLNSEDIFLEKVMFGLRTSGIEKDITDKLNKEKIDYFIENNYLEYGNSTEGFSPLLKLTDKGVLVMDYILQEII